MYCRVGVGAGAGPKMAPAPTAAKKGRLRQPWSVHAHVIFHCLSGYGKILIERLDPVLQDLGSCPLSDLVIYIFLFPWPFQEITIQLHHCLPGQF